MRVIKVLGLILVLSLLFGMPIFAAGSKGTLKIIGVPTDAITGSYDPQEGVFFADVREFAGALVRVELEDVQIIGQKMEWRTEDNYLVFRQDAKLEKEDFELAAEVIEYFGDEKRLLGEGNVVVSTKDATVYAHELVYDEKADEALFTGAVKVVYDDGLLMGEKLLMVLEKGELQFFGAFQGEFDVDSK